MHYLNKPHLLAVLFWLTIAVWFSMEHLWIGIKHRPINRNKVGVKSDTVLILAMALGMIIQFSFKARDPNQRLYTGYVLFFIGIVLAWIGMAVRAVAVKTLGKYFVITLRTVKDQKVVDYGIYKYIRHPSYTGILLTIIGLSICVNSLIGSPAFIIIAIAATIYRIVLEEKMLTQDLGKDYVNYKSHTKKLIPLIF